MPLRGRTRFSLYLPRAAGFPDTLPGTGNETLSSAVFDKLLRPLHCESLRSGLPYPSWSSERAVTALRRRNKAPAPPPREAESPVTPCARHPSRGVHDCRFQRRVRRGSWALGSFLELCWVTRGQSTGEREFTRQTWCLCIEIGLKRILWVPFQVLHLPRAPHCPFPLGGALADEHVSKGSALARTGRRAPSAEIKPQD